VRRKRAALQREPSGETGTARSSALPQGAPRGQLCRQPASRQPITDIFEEADAIIVVAELPGADPATVRCTLDGLSLLIEAAGARAYRKSLVLPAAVAPESLKTSFQNGILEVRLARRTRA
jgi:HSP20 family protein